MSISSPKEPRVVEPLGSTTLAPILISSSQMELLNEVRKKENDHCLVVEKIVDTIMESQGLSDDSDPSLSETDDSVEDLEMEDEPDDNLTLR